MDGATREPGRSARIAGELVYILGLGIGAAALGTGVATADPDAVSQPSKDSSSTSMGTSVSGDRSSPSAGSNPFGGRDVPGPASAEPSPRPGDIDTAVGLSNTADPDAVSQLSKDSSSTSMRTSVSGDHSSPSAGSSPFTGRAESGRRSALLERPAPVGMRDVSGPALAEPSRGSGDIDTEATSGIPDAVSRVVAPQSAAQSPAQPMAGFFARLNALFNNQTPTLHPTQTGQDESGVVTGELNAVDPDSPRLTFSVSRNPSHGTVSIDRDGGYTYVTDRALSQTGTVDSFAVTVSDASSGFAIHGLAGLIHLLSFGLFGQRGDSSTKVVTVVVAPFTPEDIPPSVPTASDHVLITGADLMSKPISGPDWEFLKSQADSVWDAPNLSADNTKTPARVLGAALVYARTGDSAYRDKVIAAVKAVPGTETAATIVLPFARNVFGYVVAADLVDMPLDTVCGNGLTWREFLEQARTAEFPGNVRWISLEKTAGESSSNWNAYALSSHLAVSIVLGDEAAVQRDIDIYKRFLGDAASPAPVFNPTAGYRWNNLGRTWDMTPTMQVGINPYSPADQRNGAIILDASRSTLFPSIACCRMDLAGRAYTEESLDALLAINMVLKARGYDYTDFEHQALLRAYQFLVGHGGPSGYSNGRYLALAMNGWYGTAFDTSAGDSVARHLGYGGWLF
ncbi:MAG: Ig-like domain-containing protein [Mycolicibacterium sp.]|uniref:Ig-like domain-containing protein n=1 Tax=Mycolicibacterium sp. TaxID=2320850 RepID=UPI003D0E1A54